jgi:hypothetical protein
VNQMLQSTPNPPSRLGCRGGQFQFVRRPVAGVASALLVSAGLGLAGLELAAGTAHASGAFHWCPGDPPPQGVFVDPSGHAHMAPIYPAWDTTVCHDYEISGNHVQEGTACGLPQFQWFQCPPGTTPVPKMPITPNRGE